MPCAQTTGTEEPTFVDLRTRERSWLKVPVSSMKCPFGDFEGKRGDVHRHLAETHPEKVTINQDEATGKRSYSLACPTCGAPYEHVIKPRSRDQRFLQEFDPEIKLVAFDMLLYHMQGEHSEIVDL